MELRWTIPWRFVLRFTCVNGVHMKTNNKILHPLRRICTYHLLLHIRRKHTFLKNGKVFHRNLEWITGKAHLGTVSPGIFVFEETHTKKNEHRNFTHFLVVSYQTFELITYGRISWKYGIFLTLKGFSHSFWSSNILEKKNWQGTIDL